MLPPDNMKFQACRRYAASSRPRKSGFVVGNGFFDSVIQRRRFRISIVKIDGAHLRHKLPHGESEVAVILRDECRFGNCAPRSESTGHPRLPGERKLVGKIDRIGIDIASRQW